ncbi:hypothetical protein TNCT_693081 [Trichonephila clavata]|uniref:Anaphase-promoting complex subunit 11 RING-H2 finger domain-containing protein n=1 Tax=Trichonephila clavata TaxID=2740835 RepID=A0A8X6KRT0_TRICU|nr:hypothetical protein TNCT_693081 [Trichonephila clavata]
MKIRIKKYTAVATWHWVTDDIDCGICRMPLNTCSPYCKCDTPGEKCPKTQGFSLTIIQMILNTVEKELYDAYFILVCIIYSLIQNQNILNYAF